MKCKHCGAEVYDFQTVCINCGNRLVDDSPVVTQEIQAETKTVKKISNDKKLTVLVLALAFGQVGAHCFYLGEKKKGICRILLTVFLLPVGAFLWIADVVKIATGKYTCSV